MLVVPYRYSFLYRNSLQKYNYLMHPRVNGLIYSINVLRPSLDAIYDVTIAYPDIMPENGSDLVTGRVRELE